MQYTTLGKTGLKVSVAGLGCGGNSRIGLGAGLTQAQSIALVREALDLGVNFLDTAIAYETEGIVGKAIKGRPRESVVISTKSHINRLDGTRPLSAADVIANLETSLRTLDTDYVDVFHIHGLLPAAYAEGIYAPSHRDRVYEAVWLEAGRRMCRGQSVVLDGTFLSQARRRRVYDLAQQHEAETLFLWCDCPRETALARIADRARRGDSQSEARTELYDRQAAEFEAVTADEPVVRIDTTLSLSKALNTVLERLR